MPHVRWPATVLIILFTAVLWIAHLWHPAPATDAGGISAAAVPLTLGSLSSLGDLPVPSEYRSELPGARMTFRIYGHGTDAIQFLLLSGNEEAALHDPRQCMSGWHLSHPGTARVPGTPIVMQTFEGSQAGNVPDVEVAYFYVANGRFISSSSQIRALILADAFLGHQQTPIYFLRFVQPLAGTSATAPQHHAQLLTFAAEMWKTLQPQIGPLTRR